MKPILLLLHFLPCLVFAQSDAKAPIDTVLYKNILLGARFIDKEQPDSALVYLKKAVQDMPKNGYAWYLLAVAQEDLGSPREALIDMNTALELTERANFVLTQRGLLYLNTFNYALAIEDFTEICDAKVSKDEDEAKLKQQKGMAYYYRAVAYDYLCEYKKCKDDALEAEKLGVIESKRQKKRFEIFKTGKRAANYHSLTFMSKQSGDPEYGFSPKKPIKAGDSMDGMANNEYTYLRRLLDAKGNPVKYERKGSCCAYPSKFALFGDNALQDHYEIEYQDKDGKTVKCDLYISMYDYEEPLIPLGLNAVQPMK